MAYPRPIAWPFSNFFDLSKAKKLRHAAFSGSENPKWITTTLRTVTPGHKDFRKISLNTRFTSLALYPNNTNLIDFRDAIGGATRKEWLELDLLLAQLWESHSIRPEVKYTVPSWVDLTEARSWVESLLPEVSMRGIADLSGKNDRSTYRVARKSASVRVHRLLDGGWTMAS